MTVAAVAVLAVLGAAMVALPRLVSEDEARAAATRALLDLTGIEPEIGSARLVLLPRPAVRIESVRIDDGVRPAFSARALQATLQFFPLLQGRAAIAALAFERPRLTVQTDDKGVFMIGLPFRADPAGADVAARPEIRIVDGRLMIHAADGELIESISAIDCALAWTGAGLTASGSFHWRAVPTDISLSIVDTAALVRGDRSGLRLRLDSEPMRIGFDGGIVYLNGLQADGVVSAEARSLRNALALLPAGPLTRGGFGPFQIKAQATLTPTSVNLSGLTVELDGNRAEGGLTLKHEAGRILVQATLASEASDFTPYSGGLALTGDDGRDWSREPIQLDMLDAFDLDLRLSSRRVTVRKTEFARVAAAATMRNGQFALSVGEATATRRKSSSKPHSPTSISTAVSPCPPAHPASKAKGLSHSRSKEAGSIFTTSRAVFPARSPSLPPTEISTALMLRRSCAASSASRCPACPISSADARRSTA
jgi:AsmA protein